MIDGTSSAPAGCPVCAARIAMEDELRVALRLLNARELSIAILACKLPLSGVADLVHLSRHTVADYLRRIYRKLDVADRAELATILAKCGHL